MPADGCPLPFGWNEELEGPAWSVEQRQITIFEALDQSFLGTPAPLPYYQKGLPIKNMADVAALTRTHYRPEVVDMTHSIVYI